MVLDPVESDARQNVGVAIDVAGYTPMAVLGVDTGEETVSCLTAGSRVVKTGGCLGRGARVGGRLAEPSFVFTRKLKGCGYDVFIPRCRPEKPQLIHQRKVNL